MMRTLLAVLVSLTVAACAGGDDDDAEDARADDGSAPAAADRFDDPEVQRVHRMMMDTLAPGNAWEEARYIRFDWVVDRGSGEPSRRFHRWDRWEGDYRLESPTPEGTMVALFDVDQPEAGRVWIDGAAVEGARADSLLERAYGAFINDTYWLLMPYKWTDPGVHATYEGVRTDEEENRWEVVRLTFDSVGLTPRNEYLAFVNPETGIMERWHHFSEEGAEPLVADWTDWRRAGPILLAERRPIAGGPAEIRFENVQVSREVPEGAFEPPSTGGTETGTEAGAEPDTGSDSDDSGNR